MQHGSHYSRRLIRIFATIRDDCKDSTARGPSLCMYSSICGGGNLFTRYRNALIAVRECSTCLSTHSGPDDKSVDRLPLDIGENDV